MKKLNLGCGYHYTQGWTNLDFKSAGPDVIAWDLRKGIPFPDNNFDVVYHSHLLEHLAKNEAEKFMYDCFRVLSPGGILRVVVPDLECITRWYLHALELCLQGSKEWVPNYQWIMLEMYDQAVRNKSGGDMKIYLTKSKIPNEEFIINRSGPEAREIMDTSSTGSENIAAIHSAKMVAKKVLDHLNRKTKITHYIHEFLKKIVLGKEYQTLRLGRFKSNGETHQWMYDRYSLIDLLKRVGFIRIKQQTALQSYIESWADHCLDTDRNGTVYKPDSLFVEGFKPSQ